MEQKENKTTAQTPEHHHSEHHMVLNIKEKSNAIVQEIMSHLPSEQHIVRFRRRHAGFLHAHFTTGNHHLAMLYGHRLTESTGHQHHDVAIGHAIKHVVPKHFPDVK